MKKIKEIYIITLILIIIGTTLSFATSGIVNTNGVRMRKTPSTDGEIITNLHNGDKIEIIEKDGEWYKIKYSEQEGYIHSDYVDADGDVAVINTTTATDTPNTDTPTTDGNTEQEPENQVDATIPEVYPKDVTTKSSVKIYIIPSMTASVINNIEAGQTLTVNDSLNGWAYITYQNWTGWVRNYALENKVEDSTIDGETGVSITTGYISVSSANVRAEANKSSNIVTILTQNTQVTIVAEKDNWYQIEYKEYKGYISKDLISEKAVQVTSRSNGEVRQTDETTTTKIGYVSAGVANVRKSASTSAEILTTLKQKTEVTIVGEESSFYKINISDTARIYLKEFDS